MASPGSYVDPAAGYLTVRLEVTEEDLRAVRADLATDRDDAFRRLHEFVWRDNPGVMSHEWAHIIQAATMPLLHLRAARELRAFPHLLQTITSAPEREPLPLDLALSDGAVAAGQIEIVPVRLTPQPDGIDLRAHAGPRPRRGMLRELDLVEEDATVFQYRIEVGSRGTGPGYREWLMQRPRYSSLFLFLADLFGDDDALQLIPVLARVCFATTRPLDSMAAILTDLIRDGSDVYTAEFPWDGWDEQVEDLFTHRLLERWGVATDRSVELTASPFDDERGVIDAKTYAALRERTPHLVLSTLSEWSAADGDVLRDVHRRPWAHVERGGRTWSSALDRFMPPLVCFRLETADGSDSQSVVFASPAMREAELPVALEALGEGVRMSTLLLHTLRGRQLVNAAIRRRAPLARCPHEHCRFHPTGLCSGWVPLPDTAEECDFPEFFESQTGRTVTSDGSLLVRAEGKNP